MRATLTRRYRRRSTPARSEDHFFKKESQETFFGGPSQESFFQPAVVAPSSQNVQRKCDECEKGDKKVQKMEDKKEEDKKVMRAGDKKEEEKVQKKETNVSTAPRKSVSNYIGSLNGKGSSLPAKANHFFSSRMGYDFSSVKIHNDKEAATSATNVNAKAYTIGDNIVFNEGQYNVESGEGEKLMAHELAHVMQQNEKNLMRQRRTEEPPLPLPGHESETDEIPEPAEQEKAGPSNAVAGSCKPQGIDRDTFVKKIGSHTSVFGLTPLDIGAITTPEVILVPLGGNKYKLKNTFAELPPIESYFINKDFIDPQVSSPSKKLNCPHTGKYDIKYVLHPGGLSDIEAAEKEHCADYSYLLSNYMIVFRDAVNGMKKVLSGKKPDVEKQFKARLQKITGFHPDNWRSVIECLGCKSEQRDVKEHVPAFVTTPPDQVKGVDQCKYLKKEVFNLPNLGQTTTPALMTGCPNKKNPSRRRCE